MAGRRCVAVSARTGTQCLGFAVRGSTFCSFHGGAKLKTRYGRDVPKSLQPFYHEAEGEEDVLSLRSEAAVVQAFIAEGLSGIDFEQCQAAWESLEVLAAQAREAKGAGANSKRGGLAMEMAAVVEKGVAPWKQMSRVMGYIERKRALAETEGRRQRAANSPILAKESEALVSAVVEAVWKEFEDQPERVARVAASLIHLYGRRDGDPAQPAA